MEYTLKIKGKGKSELSEMRDQLCEFVKENFDLLYFGACRLDCNLPEDWYTSRRVQIRKTRLNEFDGVKIAGGHHIRKNDCEPSQDNIRETVKDIQRLLDSAAEDCKSGFTLTIS